MNGELTVGFTGTTAGMSLRQQMQCDLVLELLRDAAEARGARPVFVDGDCPVVSADQQARAIAESRGFTCRQIPPRTRTAAELLARNVRIVVACDVLIAAPDSDHERVRSGTWSTVRRARESLKPVIMLAR